MHKRKKTDGLGSRLCLLLLVLAGLPSVSRADLYTYDFATCVTNNNPATDAQTGSQFLVDVSSVANPQQVLFTFRNIGPVASSITDVYFDDGTLLGIASVENSPGVQFTQYIPGNKHEGGNPVSPGDLPGGSSLAAPFEVTAGFSADSDSPAQSNGVNVKEYVGVLFNLQDGKDFQSVITALAGGLTHPEIEGGLRIGIHVQGFDGGGSEGFINGDVQLPPPPPPPVPVPGAVLLGLLGLGTSAVKFRRMV